MSFRSAFWAASAGYVLARAIDVPTLQRVAKPLVVPLLAADVLPRFQRRERPLAAAGLLGGWVGDVILLNDVRLAPAAATFAVNHGAYQVLLWHRGARPRLGAVALRAIPLAAVSWLGRDRLSLVLSYGGMVAATSALAADPVLRGRRVALGANLFLLSDALIFARSELDLPDDTVGRGVDVAVAVTYVLAQKFLADGLSWGPCR
ncbi:YhhN-like protein [Corynebacterium atrinae]|uniref:lysoplasmalogenase family protein n=1 Tax=Corynebacterium atrinae TaxID=1336740 RepID=UPI0025B304DA|nr:lysoplasmalogenase family protein [Corynebacterium atrinae]WJY62377.1 YhhN-like protein [Corynebacterium atrinae]